MMEKCNDQHVRYKEMERLMHCFVELHLRAGAWAILAKEYCIYMYTGRDVYDDWPRADTHIQPLIGSQNY
jgi:hypothetical protein